MLSKGIHWFGSVNPNITWGDLASWALVVVSLVGVLAAIVAGTYAKRIEKIERFRDQRRADNEKREQAILVSAWVETYFGEGRRAANIVQVLAFNGSDQPIYTVTVRWYLDDILFLEKSKKLLPPRSQIPWEADYNEIRKLVSDERTHFVTDVDALGIVDRSTVSIDFTDAQNQKWKRDVDGQVNLV